MSLLCGVKPTLMAVLGGVLLSVAVPDSSCAGQDLRNLVFHPVPLATEDAGMQELTVRTSAAPALQPELPDAAAREAEYQTAIADLRRSEGPYALALGEQLLGLGHLLQEQGRSEAALEAYATSRQILRINLGLNSLAQTPVLQAMFGSYIARGDIDNAHATQEALFNLRMRHHGYDDPAAVNALLAWADWNVNLYLLLDPPPNLEAELRAFTRLNDPRLELAYETYTQALQSLQELHDENDERLVTTERKLAALNFITNRKLQDTYGGALQQLATSASDSFADTGQTLETASVARFYDGSDALRRALAHSSRRPQRRNDDIATRMMELGDWYLLFDHRAAALDMYREALKFMREASLPQEEVERIMSPGMPVPTPDTAYLAPVAASEYAGYIDVEFELGKFGMATNPRIIGSSEENRRIERELLREIRDCKFRPKFVADLPVSSEKIRLRYYYSL